MSLQKRFEYYLPISDMYNFQRNRIIRNPGVCCYFKIAFAFIISELTIKIAIKCLIIIIDLTVCTQSWDTVVCYVMI